MSLNIDASPLDDARGAGYIVETPDGYVKSQGEVSPEIKVLVLDVNSRRRDAYKNIAKKNGISVKQVGEESYAKRVTN